MVKIPIIVAAPSACRYGDGTEADGRRLPDAEACDGGGPLTDATRAVAIPEPKAIVTSDIPLEDEDGFLDARQGDQQAVMVTPGLARDTRP